MTGLGYKPMTCDAQNRTRGFYLRATMEHQTTFDDILGEIKLRRNILTKTCRIFHPTDPVWIMPGTYVVRTCDSPDKQGGCGHVLRYMGPATTFWCRKHFDHNEWCQQIFTTTGIRLAADTPRWNRINNMDDAVQYREVKFPPLVLNPPWGRGGWAVDEYDYPDKSEPYHKTTYDARTTNDARATTQPSAHTAHHTERQRPQAEWRGGGRTRQREDWTSGEEDQSWSWSGQQQGRWRGGEDGGQWGERDWKNSGWTGQADWDKSQTSHHASAWVTNERPSGEDGPQVHHDEGHRGRHGEAQDDRWSTRDHRRWNDYGWKGDEEARSSWQ